MKGEVHVRVGADSAALRESLERVTRSLGAAAQKMGRAVGEFARKMHAAMWAAYREAGMPYGETEEGLMQWAKEVGEARRLEDEALRIRTDHLTLAQLRAPRAGDPQ